MAPDSLSLPPDAPGTHAASFVDTYSEQRVLLGADIVALQARERLLRVENGRIGLRMVTMAMIVVALRPVFGVTEAAVLVSIALVLAVISIGADAFELWINARALWVTREAISWFVSQAHKLPAGEPVSVPGVALPPDFVFAPASPRETAT